MLDRITFDQDVEPMPGLKEVGEGVAFLLSVVNATQLVLVADGLSQAVCGFAGAGGGGAHVVGWSCPLILTSYPQQ